MLILESSASSAEDLTMPPLSHVEVGAPQNWVLEEEQQWKTNELEEQLDKVKLKCYRLIPTKDEARTHNKHH
jgi:hypothetical protein